MSKQGNKLTALKGEIIIPEFEGLDSEVELLSGLTD